MRATPYVVGLTGGIASGKSTAARLFAALGVHHVDADDLAREVVMPGCPALDDIVAAFGAGALDAHGRLDRRAMRERVFADASARTTLEAIVHPRVRALTRERLARAGSPYALYVVPLLMDPSRRATVQRIAVVDVDAEVQVERVVARDRTTAGSARRILAAQPDRATRLARADDVIDNRGDEAHLRRQVEALHDRYLTLSSAAA